MPAPVQRGWRPAASHAATACIAVVLLMLVTASARAQARRSAPVAPTSDAMAESTFASLSFRSIGPPNMSGRMTDVEGVAGDPNVIYVASASGGVWKTINAGTSWTPIFDRQPVQSIGGPGGGSDQHRSGLRRHR